MTGFVHELDVGMEAEGGVKNETSVLICTIEWPTLAFTEIEDRGEEWGSGQRTLSSLFLRPRARPKYKICIADLDGTGAREMTSPMESVTREDKDQAESEDSNTKEGKCIKKLEGSKR